MAKIVIGDLIHKDADCLNPAACILVLLSVFSSKQYCHLYIRMPELWSQDSSQESAQHT